MRTGYSSPTFRKLSKAEAQQFLGLGLDRKAYSSPTLRKLSEVEAQQVLDFMRASPRVLLSSLIASQRALSVHPERVPPVTSAKTSDVLHFPESDLNEKLRSSERHQRRGKGSSGEFP